MIFLVLGWREEWNGEGRRGEVYGEVWAFQLVVVVEVDGRWGLGMGIKMGMGMGELGICMIWCGGLGLGRIVGRFVRCDGLSFSSTGFLSFGFLFVLVGVPIRVEISDFFRAWGLWGSWSSWFQNLDDSDSPLFVALVSARN